MKIKMNIRKISRCLCISALAFGVFSTSCTDEISSEAVPGSGGRTGVSEVTLKLQVPGAAAGAKTRATEPGTPEESGISDLYVLAFKVEDDDRTETLDYYVPAKVTANSNEWTASLKVKNYRQTFVMVANAQGTEGKVNEQIGALAANNVGQPKMDVLAKLTEKLGETEKTAGFNAGSHPFTMYGQTGRILVNDKGTSAITVSMHRIVARVQVTFTGDAADDTKFVAESVSLYNFNDRARVIPDGLQQTGQAYETAPSIPGDAVLLPETVDGKETVPTYAVEPDNAQKVIKNKIYLFETKQPADAGQYAKRTCLIVKGEYMNAGKAETCYYRIDFAETGANQTTYMDVIRNHTYNVTVNNVTGRGHDTPQEALESKPANIEATVVTWNDTDMGDIDFDGKNALGIGTMTYQLGKRARTGLLQQVKASTGLEWTATLYKADEYGNAVMDGDPTWIRFVDKTDTESRTISGVGSNKMEDWKFNVSKNEVLPEVRRAVMRFTAGTLKVDALVVQDQSDPVFINVKVDGKTITEDEFMQGGGKGKEMVIEFGPEGTELTWTYTSQHVILGNITCDGKTLTDMEGSKNSGTNADETLEWQGEAKPLENVDNLDYATREGVLTLIAKGKQGMAAQSIRLYQKKYGVTLEKSLVPCSGRTEAISVKGNMRWKAKMKDDDFTSATGGGYLQDAPFEGTGSPADNFVRYERIEFATMKQEFKKGRMNVELIFEHADLPDVPSVTKHVSLQPCLVVPTNPESLYLVYGPVQRSIKTITTPMLDEQGRPIDAAAVNNAEASFLKDHGGITDCQISTATTLWAIMELEDTGTGVTTLGTYGRWDSNRTSAVFGSNSRWVFRSVVQGWGLNAPKYLHSRKISEGLHNAPKGCTIGIRDDGIIGDWTSAEGRNWVVHHITPDPGSPCIWPTHLQNAVRGQIFFSKDTNTGPSWQFNIYSTGLRWYSADEVDALEYKTYYVKKIN